MRNNIVIGIEGLVGAGKTSICKNLLDKIPNSILLHGGNIYRAIVLGMMNNRLDFSNILDNAVNLDVKSIMEKLKIEIKLENRETYVYMDGKLIKDEDLQSDETSVAVSKLSNVADNSKLYMFGNKLISSFRKKNNIILSSRDIMKMYPETDYHFLITASIEERIKRKCMQYNGKISEEEVRKSIIKRDILQEDSGYYKMYPNTKKIDVTNCDSIEESTKKVLDFIQIPVNI